MKIPESELVENSELHELPQQVSRNSMALRAGAILLEEAINPHVDRFFSRELDLVNEPLKDHLVQLAESFHLRYHSEKQNRLQALGEIYDDLGQPGDVIVMLYCKKFFSLFKNWLASCAAHNIPVKQRLITFTLDREAEEQTRALGVKSYCLSPDIYAEAGGSGEYGDKAFSNTMFYKNAVINDVLGFGANVLFQDVDLVWLKDPFTYFGNQVQGFDLCIMYDGPNPNYRPLYANSGFIYAISNNVNKALFETAMRNTASIFQNRSHQKPLVKIMTYFANHNLISLKVLPQTLFLNGHLFNLKQGVREKAGDWEKNGYAVHYSWTRNMDDKRQKIRKFGLDYLSENNNLFEF